MPNDTRKTGALTQVVLPMLHSFGAGEKGRRLYSPTGLVRLAAQRCGYADDAGHPSLSEADFAALERLCAAFEAARPMATIFGKLHAQTILLDSVEKNFRLTDYVRRFPEILAMPLPEMVFIVAPFRTGTSFLHRLLACDPANRCPRVWEVAYPPPAQPELRGEARYFTDDSRVGRAEAALRALHRASPALGRLHPMGINLAEECFGLLETSFQSHSFMFYADLPSYLDYLDTRETADWQAVYRTYAAQLRVLHWWYPGRRWVLKCPAHLWNLDALLHSFPQAQMIQLHRNPVDAVESFCRLLESYRCVTCKPTSRVAIGQQAGRYLKQLLDRGVAARCRAETRHFVDVAYSRLVQHPIAEVKAIYGQIGARLAPEAEAAMRDYVAQSPGPQTREVGRGTFGLDPDDLADMFAAYSKPLDLWARGSAPRSC